jgi:hypothetical protein
MRNWWGFIAAITAVVLLVGSERQANASIISGLYNTGVDDNGNVRSNGDDELHYTLTVQPWSIISNSTPQVVTNVGSWRQNPAYPAPWVGNDGLSCWISPKSYDVFSPSSDEAGYYTYRTTFSLDASEFKRASIAGKWSTDNQGVDILINGVSTGNAISSAEAYNSFSPFQIDSGFKEGTNTLEFVVNNEKTGFLNLLNPTGLRVEMTGTLSDPVVTAAVPEPATIAIWSLLGVGAAGLAACRRSSSAKGWSAENRSAICQMIDQGRHN